MLTTTPVAPVDDAKGNLPRRHGTRRERRITTWVRRGLAATIAGLLVLATVGALYQEIATRHDRQTYPPPGQLVDVGGYRLHLNCIGEGRPTVILEAANLGMSASWVRVQQQVAETSRVCSYDRAGMGWSDAGPGPRDATRIAAELHNLLINADMSGPYVLVGHSYGGLYTLRYLSQYPGEVAGTVLLDSSHPEQFTRTAAGRAMSKRTMRLGAVIGWLTRLGVVRAIHFLPAHPDLPPEQRGQVAAFNASTQQVITSVQEFRATPETSAQVHNTPRMSHKPFAVVTAAEQPTDWLQMQDELAALSSDSVHRVVAGATHDSLVFAERDAAVSVAAIDQVVRAVRTGQTLKR